MNWELEPPAFIGWVRYDHDGRGWHQAYMHPDEQAAWGWLERNIAGPGVECVVLPEGDSPYWLRWPD